MPGEVEPTRAELLEAIIWIAETAFDATAADNEIEALCEINNRCRALMRRAMNSALEKTE